MTDWISVKDSLPPEGKMVLVYALGTMLVRSLERVDSYTLNEKSFSLYWYPGGLPIGNSSYWMPLPERPPTRAV